MFGHAGTRGTDHAGSLVSLMADNEIMAYVKRITRGFEINPETLATDADPGSRSGGQLSRRTAHR